MRGRWGFSPQTLAKGPSALWTLIRGIRLGRRPGSRRASRACRGHGARQARRDAEHARLPLSVTAFAVTPSPPGKDSLVACARAGLPYGRPASRGVAYSAIGARGGDLLRRPTEATQVPPAMGRVRRGEAFPFRLYRQRQTCSQYHKSPKTARGVRGGNAPLALHDCVAAHLSCAVTPQARRARRAPCPHATCMTPHARVA